MAYNPILNTSLRSHDKWGDFLVALIPLSWCGNILVNSNFILRMIEWQNESSLFTIRVQGKQWYWVYKYDANAAQLIFSAPKNIGHNKWFVNIPGESYTSDNYYQILQLGTQLEYRKLYLKYLNNEGRTNRNISENSMTSNVEFFEKNKTSIFGDSIGRGVRYEVEPDNNIRFKYRKEFKKFDTQITSLKTKMFDRIDRNVELQHLKTTNDPLNFILNSINNKYNAFSMLKTLNNSYYDFDLIDDLYNYSANVASETNLQAIKFVRGILNKHNIEILTKNKKTRLFDVNKISNIEKFANLYKKVKKTSNEKIDFIELFKKLANGNYSDSKNKSNIVINTKIDLLSLKKKIKVLSDRTYITSLKNKINKPIYLNVLFNTNLGITDKVESSELLWGFKQKKYKRFQKFFFNESVEYDSNTFEPINKKEVWRLKNGLVLNLKIKKGSEMDYHNSVKYNRHRAEIVPVNLARRLLRVKRTLVLPAHVNITLISNSYDVVHSWFIPGLGLKIDCVPGRSTHHTFYIDNIGFYYGQCAEICGRYHHHMPIRLCALSFEHFLVWWQKRGLKRVKRLVLLKEDKTNLKTINYASGLN